MTVTVIQHQRGVRGCGSATASIQMAEASTSNSQVRASSHGVRVVGAWKQFQRIVVGSNDPYQMTLIDSENRQKLGFI